jgi:hypothetical protein
MYQKFEVRSSDFIKIGSLHDNYHSVFIFKENNMLRKYWREQKREQQKRRRKGKT